MGPRGTNGMGTFIVAVGLTVAAVQFGLPALAVHLEDSHRPAASSIAPERLVEGYDYAFIDTVLDRPVRWPYASQIAVSVVGPVPAGTDAALEQATSLLADASRLPLRVVDANNGSLDIMVRYEDVDASDALGDDDLGVTESSGERTSDRITTANVMIRLDSAVPDPTLAHAVGLDHAVQGTPKTHATYLRPDVARRLRSWWHLGPPSRGLPVNPATTIKRRGE